MDSILDRTERNVDVWIEVPIGEMQIDSDLFKGDKLEVNNMQSTFYRRGWCSDDAFKAAQLMKQSVESRAAIQQTVSTSAQLSTKSSKVPNFPKINLRGKFLKTAFIY